MTLNHRLRRAEHHQLQRLAARLEPLQVGVAATADAAASAEPSRPAASWMLRPWPHSTHRTVTRGPSVLAESRIVSCGPPHGSVAAAVDELDVREVVEVPVLADDEEPGRDAGALARVAGLGLPLAAGVDPLRQVGPAAPAVDELELARRVERAEPVAARAANPPRERRDRHARPGVHGSSRLRGSHGAARSARTCGPSTRCTSSSSRGSSIGSCRSGLHASRPRTMTLIDGRSTTAPTPGGRDEVAGPAPADPAGSGRR